MPEDQIKKVFGALRKKILAGDYTTRFPSERMLMRQFAMTRTCIRTILAELESQHIITRRRGSGTFLVERARERASGCFGVIVQNAGSPFCAEVIEGISKSVKNSRGEYSLLVSDPGKGARSPSAAVRQATSCAVKHVTGVFLRPISSKAGLRATISILSQLREARIPVVLIDRDAGHIPEKTGCDIVLARGCSTTAFEVAARLGDIAFRLMRQRLADPSHPLMEVVLTSKEGE